VSDSTPPKGKSFTAFRSAAEEAESKHEQQSWDNEGGHMSSTAGRVVQRSGAALPFVAILSHHGGECTEHGFATMRQAEAFIRRNTPPQERALSALYDRPAGES